MGEAKRRKQLDSTFGTNPRATKENQITAYCLETGVLFATGETTMEKAKRKAEAKYPQSNFSYEQGDLKGLLNRIAPAIKKRFGSVIVV